MFRRVFGDEIANFYEDCILAPTTTTINYKVRIVQQPQRNSGDSATALGNTYINFCLLAYATWKSRGEPPLDWFIPAFIADDRVAPITEGDDSILPFNEQKMQVFTEAISLLGIGLEYSITKSGKQDFLKIQMLPLENNLVPFKSPLQQLARMFIDPNTDYKFSSQRAQAKIQCSLLSMYE